MSPAPDFKVQTTAVGHRWSGAPVMRTANDPAVRAGLERAATEARAALIEADIALFRSHGLI